MATLAIAAVIVLYYQFSPEARWFPQCPVKLLTGLSCPGCGVQRALHALLHGNVAQALSYNYFFVLSIPYLALACLAALLRKIDRGEKIASILDGRVLAWIYVAAFIVWFIVRNILKI